MQLSDFDYNLPKELIAKEPMKPRDHSRLLILDKKTGNIEHKFFYNIIDYLKKGDVLVLNNSKVFPARLIGKKQGTGGKIEVFLLSRSQKKIKNKQEEWQCLIGGRGAKPGLKIEFEEGLECEVISNKENTWEVSFNSYGKKLMGIIEKFGQVPLPPYIKREKQQKADKKTYQTIYAHDKRVGSVAAPTAGFHFTKRLMDRLKKKGIQIEYVTLHVGLGTFAPVKADNIKEHKMHSEMVEIDKKTALRIIKAKKDGKRIVAVGTTSARSLEGVLANEIEKSSKQINNYQLAISTFIYPGYKFKLVDAMITNFHLPKSTLLLLVSALAGKIYIDNAYQEAIKEGYRFHSYGDAMFIG